jgi:hypothetical protein
MPLCLLHAEDFLLDTDQQGFIKKGVLTVDTSLSSHTEDALFDTDQQGFIKQGVLILDTSLSSPY